MEKIRKQYICKNQIQKGIKGVKDSIKYIDSVLSFNDNDVTVSSGSRKVKYRYADTDYIVKPEKDIEMPESEIKFRLNQDVYVNLDKTATILQLNDIYLKGCEIFGSKFCNSYCKVIFN